MRKLTDREKVLIYIAVLLLLMSGGYYFLKLPSDRMRMEAEAELMNLQLQNAETGAGLSGKSELEKEISAKKKAAEGNRENYLAYCPNSLLIPEITSRITAFGIIPEAVEVLEVSALEAEENGYTIYKAAIRVNASGTTEDLYRLLDWTNERDWIAVTSYSSSEQEQAATSSAADQKGQEGTGSIKLTLTCLMLESDEDSGTEE